MNRIYAEQRGASDGTEHNKFFEFIDDPATQSVTFRWGSIGCAKPSVKVTVEPDAARRAAIFNAKLKEKVGRKKEPYAIIEQGTAAGVSRVEARPSAEGRGWGLEVETHSRLDPADVASRMAERGLKVNVDTGRYFHSDGRVWDVKRDGSCGYEFASPILRGDAGIFDAKLAVEKIREVCPTAVNSQCGIHVTIDVADHSDEDLRRLVIAYLKAQEFFYKACNASRQDNRYCKRNPVSQLPAIIATRDVRRALDMAGGWRNHEDRYHGLNLTRVFSRKVVEFRMMESSVDIRKVGHWIRTCVGFVDGVKATQVTFKTPTAFSVETFTSLVTGTAKF